MWEVLSLRTSSSRSRTPSCVRRLRPGEIERDKFVEMVDAVPELSEVPDKDRFRLLRELLSFSRKALFFASSSSAIPSL